MNKKTIRAVLAFGVALGAAASARYASADFPWSPWTNASTYSTCLGDTGTPGHSAIDPNNSKNIWGWCDNNKCDFGRPVFAEGCTNSSHTNCKNTTSYGGTVSATNNAALTTHHCQIEQ
jgi:hypothetical protein